MSLPEFEACLRESVRVHGHLCPGQVLGVRMSLLALRRIGITKPKTADRKNLIVFVEMDRCATDAVQSVTGCSLGRRTLKFMDYGKMAATFVNLKTHHAVRVVARDESRGLAKSLFPDAADRYQAQIDAYKSMSDGELFSISRVHVRIRPEDMPGRPMSRVVCESCKEQVQDSREVHRDGRVLCRSCADGAYYEVAAAAPVLTADGPKEESDCS